MIKSVDKRLNKLEALTPEKEYPSYGELLKRESTPGTEENEEFMNLYNENKYEDQ
ncbi:hypothetical protein [Gracilimonas mengyeensis]|uniref:Uncharacterized protein n=1 Tax=Gracilimonas mengyeensis TaxID=1302730 RepID=A0A521EL34_9BACT|nr:hypothetical protein [Gracilimonas mengyeensis]SMO84171.1 hypothetical protein SAMN06265219_11288 [Gracilimonas mengyeensis]